MSSVSNGLYFLTLPPVSVMRAWGARYTLGARYLSKNTVFYILRINFKLQRSEIAGNFRNVALETDGEYQLD